MKCCNIAIGQLNRKIDLYTLSQTSDGQGGFDDSFVLFASLWAKLEPMKGREKIQSDRLTSEQMIKAITRYRAGIEPTMKVIYNGNDYQIRSIVNIDESNDWLEIMIERIAAQ